jgi:hypothetical protein
VPISPLTLQGILPEGIYECTLNEIEAVFVTNAQRKSLWSEFRVFIEWVKSMKTFDYLYIDGSFVTRKTTTDDEPNDIDCVLELPPPSPSVKQMIDANLLNHGYVKDKYKVDLYIVVRYQKENDLREFFQYLRPEEAMSRGLKAGDKKGILKIRL